MSLPATFCLADDHLAASERAPTKFEGTRLRVLGLTAQSLDRSTSTQLTPAEAARHAGLSRPLMHLCFGDVAGLFAAIMGELEKRAVGTVRRVFVGSGSCSFGQLVGCLAWVLAVVPANPGAFRTMHNRSDQLPGVEAAWNRLAFELNRSLGEHLMPPSHLPTGAGGRLLMGDMVAQGFKSLARELFVQSNDHLPRLFTPEALLNLVPLAHGHRHRLIHGADPAPDEVRAMTEGFDLSFFEDCFREHKPSAARAAVAMRSKTIQIRRA